MQTLYVDIYFLINFTVDLIALHLASEFSKIEINGRRLVLFAFFLSVAATAEIFLPDKPLFEIIVNIVCITFVFITPKPGISIGRRFRFWITSYMLLMLIGGIVFALFNAFKKYADNFTVSEPINRKLLMLAIIVLISVGCVKIFVSILKDVKNEKHIVMEICFNERKITVESFVDTGNLLKDPMDMTPVMLLKERLAKELFPNGIPEDISYVRSGECCNVRLIPIKRGEECEIKLGFRPTKALIINGSRKREIKVCFIIDNERGNFGGYDALVPASLIE